MSDQAQSQHLSEAEEFRQQSEIAARLREAIKSAGGYNAVVARSGVSGNSLNRYLRGQEMKVSTAFQLAEACRVTPQWLLFGDALPPPDGSALGLRPSALGEIDLLDYYDTGAVREFGQPGAQAPQQLMISAAMAKIVLGITSGHAMILRVADDSMAPTLSPGEHVIVDTSRMTLLTGLAVLTINGSLHIKRIATLASGNVLLTSDNDRYPNEEVPLSMFRQGEAVGAGEIGVVGRVTMRLQPLS